MPFMTWADEMSVGVKVLDDDHKTMIRLLSDLHDVVVGSRARSALDKAIEGMLRSTKAHFAREEILFKQTAYPGAAEHKAEHEQLARRAMNLQARLESGQSKELSLQTMELLKSWLIDHIEGSDKKYGPHLKAKGIQ
jgi:hemerythrin